MTPGQALKQRREAAGLSQQQLAVAIEMSVPIVSRWERDANRPSRDAAQRVDDVLNAGGTLVSAFGYANEQPTTIADLKARIDDLEARLVALEAERVRPEQFAVAASGDATGRPSRTSVERRVNRPQPAAEED